MFELGIITCSDKGSKGQRDDLSGKLIQEILEKNGFHLYFYAVIPDDFDTIKAQLVELSDIDEIDLIITTGGTGITKRDVTPEATKAIVEKEILGIPEIMRVKTYDLNPLSIISRSVCGYRNKTLIINLPGNPRAISECLNIILPVLDHAIKLIQSDSLDH
ncbi:MAG: MogA/MoaB family molybdenum cofactor biosynthesis protein [SAR202 cluster bacterium]|nr:molybdenum cofactor biosynthesis protein [Chloroflexota bacterium]MQG50446.1 MogA/MoaB family molybdenum cofactor biosynthesis protein [SAR202 cluster bacterium]|tara:strand:+ start:2703 stop:3185 length:483 start_codon:yes stop_codon:yes gene_type:complete